MNVQTILSLCAINCCLAFELLAASFSAQYDSLNRITNVTYVNGTIESYTYDAAGNRLSIKITAPNRTPVAINDTNQYSPGQSLKIAMKEVLANDSDQDGDSLSVTGVSERSEQGGTVRIDGQWIIYTPPAGHVGADSFSYTVSDGRDGQATATVSLIAVLLQRAEEIRWFPNGASVVRFIGIPNMTYTIQISTNLADWVFYRASKAGPDGVFQIVDTDHVSNLFLFYRSVHP